jgi:UTP--glucose-1-phosphate uridylyltransferase
MQPIEPLLPTARCHARAQGIRAGAIRKAVLPVAGLGTRFLPATKAVPKEMLPIVDRPLIQYAVDEAAAAGIEEIIFVTSRTKRAIEDHFELDRELQARLHRAGNDRALAALGGVVPPKVRFCYVRQTEPLGLGHAILCARHVVGDEPFAVMLPDDLMDGEPPILAQMVFEFERTRAALVAVQSVPRHDTKHYGVVDAVAQGGRLARIRGVVEKPSPAAAPSTSAIVGRYILTSSIFDRLAAIGPGSGGEIQLTDGLAQLLEREPVFAFSFSGRRYDCGTKIGFLEATVNLALRHAELADEFKQVTARAARSIQGDWPRFPVSTEAASGPLHCAVDAAPARHLSLVHP